MKIKKRLETFKKMLERHSKEIRNRKKICKHPRVHNTYFNELYCTYCNKFMGVKG